MYAANDPVIEASSNLTFAPFNIGYPKLREHALTAGLDPAVNKWELVFDFSHKGEDNYRILPISEFSTRIESIEGFEEGEIVFDYPMRYGGTTSDSKPNSSAEHDQNMSAFSITTGQEAAQVSF